MVGFRVELVVEPGDAVITPKLDRMFRSASDALGTLEEMKGQDVQLHMIDLGGDVCGSWRRRLRHDPSQAVQDRRARHHPRAAHPGPASPLPVLSLKKHPTAIRLRRARGSPA